MPKKIRLDNLSRCTVFFDFDNTIVPFDVLDDIIERFSINDDWIALERLWKAGRIGSEECLRGQLRSVRVTKKRLSQYLARIKIVPYFRRLTAMLKREGVRPVILSDDFSFIIRSILKANGIKGIRVYSNKVRFAKERLIPSFPHRDKRCRQCGHCKKKHLIKRDISNKIRIYIGDGLSDLCPARHAEIVFAKGVLLSRLRRRPKESRCIPFKGHKDIYDYLRRSY